MELKKSNWLWGAILFIVGLLMIINPHGFAKLVVVLLGLASVAFSVYNIIYTRKTFDSDNDANYRKMIFIRSCVGVVFGVLAVIFAMPFAKAAMNVGFYIFAVYLICAACFGFYTVSLLKNADVDRKRYIFENLSLLVAAILIFLITPEKMAEVLIRIFGIVGLVAGLVLLAIEIIPAIKGRKNEIEVAEVDVTVVDETATPASEETSSESTEDKTEN